MRKIAIVLLITTFLVVKLSAQSEQAETHGTPALHRHLRLHDADIENVFNYHGPELTKEQVCRLFFNHSEFHLKSIDGIIIQYPDGEIITTLYSEVVLLPGQHVIEGYITAFHVNAHEFSDFGRVYVKRKLSFVAGREQSLFFIFLDEHLYKEIKHFTGPTILDYNVTLLGQPRFDIGVRTHKKPNRKNIPIIY